MIRHLLKFLTAILLFTAVSDSASAHAIWIETSANGVKGKPQQVKVFFGEYTKANRDTVARWYSDINKLSLWVTQPGKPEKQLQLTDSVDFYAASFTPDADGVYTLVIRHPLKDLFRTYKLEYNAMAPVWVGAKPVTATPVKADITLTTPANQFKQNEKIALVVHFEGKVLPEQEVEIVSPTGKKETVKTNKSGALEFIPTESGRYLTEVIYRNKVAGTHNGKAFDTHMKIATLNIPVL